MNTGIVILISVLSFMAGVTIGIVITVIKERHFGMKEAEDEIISIVNEGTENGQIEESEAEMINNIFEFGDKVAKDIMTDRSNILAFDVEDKLEEVIEKMLDSSNSRFPVYDDNLDHIIGIVHLKDAISANRNKLYRKKSLNEIEDIVRDVKFIPETRKVDALFATMRTSRLQMVIVVDEYGQTAGIVSMKDILEEIVGDIDDEFDNDDDLIVVKDKNKYIIDGLTELDNIENLLDIKFEEENFETINGFLISKLEHIPDKKEKFEYDYEGYRFKVLSVENKMIKQILITKIENNSTKQNDSIEESSEE